MLQAGISSHNVNSVYRGYLYRPLFPLTVRIFPVLHTRHLN